MKYEIKYLHIKKQQSNNHIYHLHLILANIWNNTGPYIKHTIEEKPRKTIQTKYKNLDSELAKLERQQQQQQQQQL